MSHKSPPTAKDSRRQPGRRAPRPLVAAALLALLALAAAGLALMVFPDRGRSADTPSPWLSDDRPLASFLFTNEDVLGRLAGDLGLSAGQLDTIRQAARDEADTLASLKSRSQAIADRQDLSLEERQAAISGMDYNGQLREQVRQSRSRIEAVLGQQQLEQLPGWVQTEMERQKQDFAGAAIAAAGSPIQALYPGPFRVYATQYYSNFGPASVDVAVPDQYVKFASLGWEYHAGYPEGGSYSVNMSNNGNQLNGVQVKDCGPWNIDDNYWNPADGTRPRRLFTNLPVGLPESQAAYFSGYNGGMDQFGRLVSNPAGIDLSPQAGVGLGLGYLVSGWITVSFNWEGTPPIPIYGAILARYNSLGGAPGRPVNAEHDVPGGRAQDFQVGRLIWNRASGRVFWVLGAILAKYDSFGGPGGGLGHPLSDEYDVPGGRASNFQGGHIYYSSATGSVAAVYGGILGKFLALGGPDVAGLPQDDEHGAPGGGRVSDFSRGSIYWTPDAGSFWVMGAIGAKYASFGGPAGLGLPLSDEYPAGPGRGQNFQAGRIYWTPSGGAAGVYGSILARYLQLGGPAVVGLPAGDEHNAPGGGRVSDFSNGSIYWSPGAGSFWVMGAIGAKYRSIGDGRVLGLPISEEYTVQADGGTAQNYQGGRIFWRAQTGAAAAFGAILSKYDALGGWLGSAIADEADVPGVAGARFSSFSGGRIYWSPRTGTFSVNGAILAKYVAQGAAKTMGLPLADEAAVPGSPGARMSVFERARIYWSPQVGTHQVFGAIMGRYLLLGGPASPLGLPVSDEYGTPGGRRSDFQGGSISWDLLTGGLKVSYRSRP